MTSEKPRSLYDVLNDLDTILSIMGCGTEALHQSVPDEVEEIKQWERGDIVYYIGCALELQHQHARKLMEEAHKMRFAIRDGNRDVI